jgi:hypothetical protein
MLEQLTVAMTNQLRVDQVDLWCGNWVVDDLACPRMIKICVVEGANLDCQTWLLLGSFLLDWIARDDVVDERGDVPGRPDWVKSESPSAS